MFEEPEYVTSQTDDIVIICGLRTIRPKKFSCWAKTGILPTVSATVFAMIPPDLKASFPNWNPANVLSSVQ